MLGERLALLVSSGRRGIERAQADLRGRRGLSRRGEEDRYLIKSADIAGVAPTRSERLAFRTLAGLRGGDIGRVRRSDSCRGRGQEGRTSFQPFKSVASKAALQSRRRYSSPTRPLVHCSGTV